MAFQRGVSLADSGASAATGIFVTLAAPAGTVAGDQLVATIELREAPDTLNPTWRVPTNWTLVAEVPTTGASSSGTGFIYRATYGDGTGGTVTGSSWTWDNGASNTTGTRWTAELVALDGSQVGTYQTSVATQQASASTSQASGSVTSTGSTVGLAIAGSRLTGGVTYTWPAGWTELADAGNGAQTNSPTLSSAVSTAALSAGSQSVTATASASVTNGFAALLIFNVATGSTGSGTLALSGTGTLSFAGSSGTGAGSGTLALSGTGTLVFSGSGTLVPVARAVQWSAFARGANYALSQALPISDATAVIRHMGLSKATLTTPFTVAAWTALQPSYGIALYRSGVQKFAGPVVSRTLSWDGESNAATIKVEAVGDEVVLDDRLAMPDPLRAADDQTVNDYWTYTGKASTAMRQLISDQAGATCAAARKVTGLTLGVDPNVGASRTWQGLFDNVLDLLAQISASSGSDLGLRMTSSTGGLVATVVAPRDRTGAVTFSADLSNVGSTQFTEKAPTVANALVAGQGDLHLRTRKAVASVDSGTTRWARQAWTYRDRRDTNDLTTLTNAGSDELVRGQASVSLSMVLLDSQAATYGTDWDLGDKVTVYVGLPGQSKVATVNDLVRELTFTIRDDGSERIQAAIGSVDARTYLPTPAQRALTAVDQRVSDLIKNK